MCVCERERERERALIGEGWRIGEVQGGSGCEWGVHVNVCSDV